MKRPLPSRLAPALAAAAALCSAAAIAPGAPAHAQSRFAVGIPTVVDPVRGVGEPDLIVDNSGNPLVTGPAGSGAQTSFFWRSPDGGQTYSMLGPSQGHWVCPASGGGDSLAVMDQRTGDIYLTDQEALADIGSAKIDGATGQVTSQCATAPGATADRPFEGVLDSTTAPQTRADGKPIVYLSWLCAGCTGIGTGGPTEGGIAFGWSDDGLTFHAADPGVAADTVVTNTLQEGGALQSLSEHGNTVTDPQTGYVYTGITCSGSASGSPSGCPNGSSDNEVGLVVGAPQANPNPANIGQFATLTYQPAVTTDPDGQPLRQPNSLFPVLGIDSNGTLYEAYIEGDGFATTTDPLPSTAWHLYYAYSTDRPLHKTWSKPVRVDMDPRSATTDFGWMAVGDPGKLGFVWLGTDRREHPSFQDASDPRTWHAFMGITTDGLAAHPSFQETQVGIGPNHINDMCLQGTVGCIQNVGNRNMADFISCDIGPDGALQATWANDSNRLATLPTTLIPGLPLTETAHQVAGPRLRGSGDVTDPRFSTTPVSGVGDPTGETSAIGSLGGQPALDLTGSQVTWDGSNLVVHATAANLSAISSPSTAQPNVWYLTTWQFNHTIYFARAQVDGTGTSFFAGPAKSFDRPGLNAQTVATLVDYSGGTAIQGTVQGNQITMTVPASLVGSPAAGSLLESVTGYTALDNGAPLFVGPGTGNMPTIVDSTIAYDDVLGAQSATGGTAAASTGNGSGGAPIGLANTSASGGGSVAMIAGVGGLFTLLLAARRRRR